MFIDMEREAMEGVDDKARLETGIRVVQVYSYIWH